MIDFTKEQIDLLVELIANEQIHMTKKDFTRYETEKYRMLEKLKVKIKKM